MGVCSFNVLCVISASGVPGIWLFAVVCMMSPSGVPGASVISNAGSGSGDIEGSGVRSCESSSTGATTADARDFLPRFFGTAFEGDCGLVVSGAGVNNCVGSTDSVTRGRRLDVALGVAFSSVAAAFRGRPRPLPVLRGAGAGVNSSSPPSSLISGVGVLFSSSSESSMTGAFRLVAAARVDFRGDISAMGTGTAWLVGTGTRLRRYVFVQLSML
jgi:hypothetical protein